MWQSKKGRYVYPQFSNDTILWRYSLLSPGWKAPEVQGIDYSTMLFGLASLPQFLGKEFFVRNNNFFGDQSTAVKAELPYTGKVRIMNNRVHDLLVFKIESSSNVQSDIKIITVNAETVYTGKFSSSEVTGRVPVSNLPPGIYFLLVSENGKPYESEKFIKY